MILKVLLIVGVIAFVYFFFIKKKPLIKNATKEDTKLQSSDMVECSSCGVYAQVDDSILSGASYYCSQECLERKK
jgi:uncharacterized protein